MGLTVPGIVGPNHGMRVGVDIGGAFTDVVVFDDAHGAITLAKAPSTPRDLAQGVRDALRKSGAALPHAETMIHGSTVVVNAIVERRGARTALLTTAGFRDVYEIGRINRPESFNPGFRKHRPLVPRENEAAEAKAPIVCVQRALRQDSGGPGRFRGGLGIAQQVELRVPAMYQAQVERTLRAPWGFERRRRRITKPHWHHAPGQRAGALCHGQAGHCALGGAT